LTYFALAAAAHSYSPIIKDHKNGNPQLAVSLQVFPEQMDIRAHSSATFRIAFRPPLDGQYFSQTMEVVACFKAHRSFRGVAHNAVLPPWTLPVQVMHTDTRISIHMQTVHFSTVPSTLYSRPKSIHVQVGSTYLCTFAHFHQQVSIAVQQTEIRTNTGWQHNTLALQHSSANG